MDLYTPKLYIVPSSDDLVSELDLQNHHIEEHTPDPIPNAATSSRHIPLAEGAQSNDQPLNSVQLAMSSYSAQAFLSPFVAYGATPSSHFEQNEPWVGNYGGYSGREIPGNINHGRPPAQGPSLHLTTPPPPHRPALMNEGYQVEDWNNSTEVPTQMLRHQISTNEQPLFAVVSGNLGPPHRRALRAVNPQLRARTGRPTSQDTRDLAREGLDVKSPGLKRLGPVLRGKPMPRFRPCPVAFRGLPAYLNQRDLRHQLFNCFEGCHKLRFGENGFSRRSNLLAHLRGCHRQEVPHERE